MEKYSKAKGFKGHWQRQEGAVGRSLEREAGWTRLLRRAGFASC